MDDVYGDNRPDCPDGMSICPECNEGCLEQTTEPFDVIGSDEYYTIYCPDCGFAQNVVYTMI